MITYWFATGSQGKYNILYGNQIFHALQLQMIQISTFPFHLAIAWLENTTAKKVHCAPIFIFTLATQWWCKRFILNCCNFKLTFHLYGRVCSLTDGERKGEDDERRKYNLIRERTWFVGLNVVLPLRPGVAKLEKVAFDK